MSKNLVAKTSIAAASLLATVSFAVNANAAPALLHEVQSVEINAPVDAVWAIAGSFADLTWVPAVKASTADAGNKVGSHRRLDFGGPILTETLAKYDAKHHTYTYEIDNTEANHKLAPLSDVKAVISVKPNGAKGSIATWDAHFHRVNHSANAPAGADDAAAQKQMAATITMGLGGLKAKAEAAK